MQKCLSSSSISNFSAVYPFWLPSQDVQVHLVAADVLQRHPESKELANLVGELLGKAGAGEVIESLIEKIVTTMKSKPTGWQRSTEALCSKLALFLPAGVADPAKSFKQTPELCSLMAEAIVSEKSDLGLLSALAVVNRALADRFAGDSTSPYGLLAIEPSLMPALAKEMAQDPKAQQNRMFLTNGYRAMAVMALNKGTHAKTLSASQSSGLIEQSFKLLKEYKNDPVVLARILEYLDALSTTPEGSKAVVAAYKVN